MRKIFYDFEVFSNAKDPETGMSFWLVVLVDYDTKKGKVIINDLEMLKQYYNYFKNDIFIGYNSRNYDQFIFKGLLMGMDAGFISRKLIEEGKKGYEVVRGAYKIPFNNFDIMPNPPIGLKTMEGFMGSDIKETDVPFDLARPLTQEEIDETVKYCIHDVKETIKVFDAKTEEFESQLQLIEAFDLDMSQFNKTKAQLSAHILEAEKHPDRGDEFDFILPDTLVLDKYKHIKEWYEQEENKSYLDEKGKKKQLKVDIADTHHVLGYGGIHGSKDKYSGEGIILCADIASMYPALIIEYNLMSRNVESVEKYRQIRDERLKLKAAKNPKQQPLKIVLNATFGTFKDQFNAMFDKRMSNSICISGQLLLVDLIEKVEPYCELLQSNTDGIFMKVENYEMVDKIKEVAAEWEKRTRLDLEWEEYSKIYQKDVNNYIIIDKDGKYKSKGAYVKKLNDLDYDLPIVNKALINYFINKTPLEETINACDELREFQKLVKVSYKYLYGLHGEERLKERVLRVFADKREDAKGIFKMKLKMKDGVEQEVAEKIANTPEKSFIDNDDIIGKKIPEYLDKQYYVDIAQKRLNDFLGIPNKRKKATKKKTKETEK
ncbi:hypothetical protein [Priestia aryabhattai]|uniref:hypothetical protein n=1 Tax=Priestia aryabhattai TaxID=412384 RepID=UPI001C70DC82|nr:hypothetical protein [Priestia aryabhattai]